MVGIEALLVLSAWHSSSYMFILKVWSPHLWILEWQPSRVPVVLSSKTWAHASLAFVILCTQHLVTSKEVSCLKFLEKRENDFHLLASCIGTSVCSCLTMCFKLKTFNILSMLSTRFTLVQWLEGRYVREKVLPSIIMLGAKTICLLEEGECFTTLELAVKSWLPH